MSKKNAAPVVKGDSGRVDTVAVDGLVVLKIVKHARENPHEMVSGPLLGLVIEHNLEITNSFALPRESGEDGDDLSSYQTMMLRLLREVNIDHLQVGWYQASNLGAFLTEDFISIQYQHQSNIEESVVLIYDPVRTLQGSLTLKAFRLTPASMEMFKKKEFSSATVKALKLTYDTILEEVPLVVKTSHLSRALLDELDRELKKTYTFDRLDLNTQTFLEKNVRFLMDCVDELSTENQKYHQYQKAVSKAEQLKRQFIEKRKLENAQRLKDGQPLLPEDDPNPQFKPPAPVSRLDSLLIAGQISHYCSQISQFASQSFGKLFLAQGLQPQIE